MARKYEVLAAAVAVAYLIILAFTWLTPSDVFMIFLKVYLTLLNGVVALAAIWALVTLAKRPRPVPLPELEKKFEAELERLVKEWEEVEGSESSSN